MKNIFLTLFLLLCTILVHAQKREADEQFRLYRYAEAIPLYEKYISKNQGDYDANSKLATAFKLTNNIDKAIEVYKYMVQLPESKPDDLLQLVQLLQIVQKQADARQYAHQYQQRVPGEKANTLIESLDNYVKYMSTADEYKLTNKTSQYPFSVLSVYPLTDKLVVTAENRKGKSNKWTGRSFTDLYLTDASFSNLDPYATELMTEYDDGIATFTQQAQNVYITSANKNTVHEEQVNTRKLMIRTGKLEAGKWLETQDFPYNADGYNTAHPTISQDGNLLVFASDMPGGKGGMDLYYCTRQGATWAQPKNISNLNTFGNEIFPVFQDNTTLIFSSNGLPGLGGLDMYKSEWNGIGFTGSQNMQAPLNSSFDDYGLISLDDMQSGYLTSNRSGNPQVDNVYYFSKQAKNVASPVSAKGTSLNIKVLDKYTLTPLPYVAVTIKDKNGNTLHKGLTDENGTVIIEEIPKNSYQIQGLLNDVTTTIATVEENEFDGKQEIKKELLHNDPRFTMKGIVINAKTNKPIEGVTVTCLNKTHNFTRTIITGTDGVFFFQLEQKSDFSVYGKKSGWLSSETAEETTKGLDRSKELYVKLSLMLQQPTSNDVIRLDKIYYDYDKCNIKPASAVELDRLVTLLNDFSDMQIELSSHTDSRGSDAYNDKLSQCRADAAVQYLLNKGISSNRLQAKGYGETRLVNKCANGIPCSEDMHQQNRRTEFKIITCNSCPAVEP